MHPQWTKLVPKRAQCPTTRPYIQHKTRQLTTLAIETSCDDTCVAILHTSTTSSARLLFNDKLTSDNRRFGGVYPPTSLESHVSSLAPLVQAALRSTHLPRADLVAATRGPGMLANLAEGLSTAKGLAAAWNVPFIAVNHMHAHALTPRLVSALQNNTNTAGATPPPPSPRKTNPSPQFPFLTLLVSGGHTQLVHSLSLTTHHVLLNTIDIAVGDSLDKCARLILPPSTIATCPDVMYGRALESFAFPSPSPLPLYTPPPRRADEISLYTSPFGWHLRPPLMDSRRLAYNFCDFPSQVQRIMAANPEMGVGERRELAVHVMRLAFEHLCGRMLLVLGGERELVAKVETLVVSGGVASNRFLMMVLKGMLAARGYGHLEILAPPAEFCTDNAAMIAWAGWEMYEAGYESELSVKAIRKWPVDATMEGGGILEVGGWIQRDGCGHIKMYNTADTQ